MKGKEARNIFRPQDAYIRQLLARPAEAAWTAALKPTPDYKAAEALVEMPGLKPGFFRVLASFDPAFSTDGNKIVVASLWVSELGLVTGGPGAGVQGLVVRNAGGEPVPGAAISLWQWDYDSGTFTAAGTARTDALGAFTLSPGDSFRDKVLIVRDSSGAEIAENRVETNYPRSENPYSQTVFFTDRAIYRPGQTVYFKGLCLSVDRNGNDYKLLPRQSVRVVFRDANQQEITALSLVTNDFGSFSGTFTAPADRLTGLMTIETPLARRLLFRPGRGIQAAQVRGQARRPRPRVPAERRGRRAGRGAGLHRRAGRRRGRPLPRRPRGPLSPLVALLVRRALLPIPGDRPRHGADGRGRKVHGRLQGQARPGRGRGVPARLHLPGDRRRHGRRGRDAERRRRASASATLRSKRDCPAPNGRRKASRSSFRSRRPR